MAVSLPVAQLTGFCCLCKCDNQSLTQPNWTHIHFLKLSLIYWIFRYCALSFLVVQWLCWPRPITLSFSSTQNYISMIGRTQNQTHRQTQRTHATSICILACTSTEYKADRWRITCLLCPDYSMKHPSHSHAVRGCGNSIIMDHGWWEVTEERRKQRP